MQKKKELERVDHPPNLFGKFAHSWLRFADKAKDDTAKVEAETLGSRVDDALGLIRGILEKWPIPRVRDNRAFQWRSDEEFARAVSATPLCLIPSGVESICNICCCMYLTLKGFWSRDRFDRLFPAAASLLMPCSPDKPPLVYPFRF